MARYPPKHGQNRDIAASNSTTEQRRTAACREQPDLRYILSMWTHRFDLRERRTPLTYFRSVYTVVSTLLLALPVVDPPLYTMEPDSPQIGRRRSSFSVDDPEQQRKAEHGSGFGHKTIGFFGGFALLVNNMTGPGMTAIPPIFQQAGWLVPSLCFLVVALVATLSSTMLCQAMASIPGNDKFQDRVELTTLAKRVFGKWGFYFTMLLFVLSLQSVNVASIVESAQTMDLTIIRIFGKSCALEFAPDFGFICHKGFGTGVSPFGDDVWVISIGFLVILLMAVPLGYVNLDDNIGVQKGAFVILMIICVEWFVWFVYRGDLDYGNVPAVGKDMSQVLGTIVFNYAYVTTIPSCFNEKKPHVSINTSMWSSAILSFVLFMFLGVLGAWSYHYSPSDDVLSKINDDLSGSPFMNLCSQVTVYLFPLVALVSGIPIFSIIVRYNLMENKVCGKGWANVWGVLFPWLVSIPAYTGSGLLQVINWTSLLVNGFINFVIPTLIYIVAVAQAKRRDSEDKTDMSGLLEDPDSSINRSSSFASEPFSALPKWVSMKHASYLAWSMVVFFSSVTVIAIAIALKQQA